MPFGGGLWSFLLGNGANSLEHVSPSFAPPLPADIVLTILEYAYYNQGLDPDTQLLANCAQVCKAWSAPAQNLLFRDVHLQTNASLLSFASVIKQSSLDGRDFGDIVVRLRIVLDIKRPDGLCQDSLSQAMRLCPNLYELDLTLHGGSFNGSSELVLPTTTGDSAAATATDSPRASRPAPPFSAETLDALRAGPRIRSLKFTNLSDNDQLALQLLSVWSSLDAVALKGTPPCLVASEDQEAPATQCLSGLTTVRLGFQPQSKMTFVDWLLSHSAETLRSLELEQDTPPEILTPLLKQYGPNLHSLALPLCTSRSHVTVVTQHCVQLRELRIGSPQLPLSPLLFKQLPSTLEHFAFTLAHDTLLYLVVNYVKACSKKFRALTVHIWEGAEAHPQLPSLRIACAMKGVALRCTRNPWAFRELTRGDTLSSSTFPLQKSPANLSRMLYIARAGSPKLLVQPEAQPEDGLHCSPEDMAEMLLALGLDICDSSVFSADDEQFAFKPDAKPSS